MSNKRLLRSWPEFTTPAQLNESVEQNNGKIILKGILQKANTLNQNGRIYPKDILQRELENYQKYIIERRATGVLDHPDHSVVELKEVSHNIIETWWEGNVVWGRIEVLNTPNGKILQTLIQDKIKLGISSRGVGSTQKEDDYQVVQDDFQLICWDMVSEPSTPGAFMIPENSAFSASGKKIISSDESFFESYNKQSKSKNNQSYIDTINSILVLKDKNNGIK